MIVVRGVPVSEDEAAELARRLGAHHDQRCMRTQARNKRGAGYSTTLTAWSGFVCLI
jgi:hypothetical protein